MHPRTIEDRTQCSITNIFACSFAHHSVILKYYYNFLYARNPSEKLANFLSVQHQVENETTK